MDKFHVFTFFGGHDGQHLIYRAFNVVVHDNIFVFRRLRILPVRALQTLRHRLRSYVAAAVQAALDGVAQIDVFNRQESYLQRGYELIDRLHGYSPCEISLYALSDEDQLRASLAESALVVNTTTVGYPDDPGCLLTADMLRPELIVADLVYNPRNTELIQLARSCGCKTVDGAGPFVQQAAIAERLWLGREMPVDFAMETFFAD